MEITKRGDPSSQIWNGTCSHCRTEMRAEQRELNVRVDGHNEKYRYYAYYDCPVCFKKSGVTFRPQSELQHGGEL